MLNSGDVFAGFTIERLLGQGGMGAVYLARHPRLGKLTALKLLNRELYADREIRARFEREADLVAQLDHPNIVEVFDRGTEDEQLWISMQYVDGVDAAAVDVTQLPPERAVQVIEGVAGALDYAHGMGVLHRDVKPANIILARAIGGHGERVFLTDFGIARLREDSTHLTQAGMFTATLAYASPEQMTGAPLDSSTDQYSLALSLYWLLVGAGPYDSPDPQELINGHLQMLPPPVSLRRPGLTQAMDAVLSKGMAKRPADRFPTCSDFAKAARRALTAAQPLPSHLLPQTPRPYPNPPGAHADSPQPYPPGYVPQPGYPAAAPSYPPAGGYPPAQYPVPPPAYPSPVYPSPPHQPGAVPQPSASPAPQPSGPPPQPVPATAVPPAPQLVAVPAPPAPVVPPVPAGPPQLVAVPAPLVPVVPPAPAGPSASEADTVASGPTVRSYPGSAEPAQGDSSQQPTDIVAQPVITPNPIRTPDPVAESPSTAEPAQAAPTDTSVAQPLVAVAAFLAGAQRVSVAERGSGVAATSAPSEPVAGAPEPADFTDLSDSTDMPRNSGKHARHPESGEFVPVAGAAVGSRTPGAHRRSGSELDTSDGSFAASAAAEPDSDISPVSDGALGTAGVDASAANVTAAGYAVPPPYGQYAPNITPPRLIRTPQRAEPSQVTAMVVLGLAVLTLVLMLAVVLVVVAG